MNHNQIEYLFKFVEQCLIECSIVEKLQLVDGIYQRLQREALEFSDYNTLIAISEAGFPDKPELVSPRSLPKRGVHNKQARIALLHSIAHIEFNAINLALDAIYRFRDMPDDYFTDWLRVAFEEVKHFKLLRARLNELGSDYGMLPAHCGLWEMAEQTQHDVLVRMALVPRYLEARGLDVTPDMIKKFESINDQASVQVLRVILEDEIGHVRIGSKWFRYVCEQRNLDPEFIYFDLINQYLHGEIRGPFNFNLRRKAGFSENELKQIALY